MHYVKCNQYSKHKKILLLKHVARKIKKETDCLPTPYLWSLGMISCYKEPVALKEWLAWQKSLAFWICKDIFAIY